MLFVLAIASVAYLIYMKREALRKKADNFSKLVRSFKNESYGVALYKSTCIIIKCFFSEKERCLSGAVSIQFQVSLNFEYTYIMISKTKNNSKLHRYNLV